MGRYLQIGASREIRHRPDGAGAPPIVGYEAPPVDYLLIFIGDDGFPVYCVISIAGYIVPPVGDGVIPMNRGAMSKMADREVVRAALSMGRAVEGMGELPKRVDITAFAALASRVERELGEIDARRLELASLVNDKDADVKALAARMGDLRTAVKGAYGADSNEYARVGGTRARDRKKPGPKPRQR